ncbi:hypothetical protein [Alicyclobacillus tolerans]|uniref:Uncharacterized protein n=1 Tax=Alicyclobacillus tolerans TaxID=90970 RepID=A0A1M6WYL8_9BACL|nr:hypothetical protein [Alicyclobacillus montanus]SHK98818.1 hypothetical protein SAMN05443507_13030 [Alicyclobacillus montanus]
MTKRDTTREWEHLFKEKGEELEIEELTKMLDEYTVEFPPEHIIQNTIENCIVHVPQYASERSKLKRMFHTLSLQVEYVSKWFWLFSLLLFVSGYVATVFDSISPYKTVLVLSPMPFILGVLEILRSTDSGMAEMELASKMSLPQIMMARFALIGSYNVVLNAIISFGLYWTFGIDLWKVLLFWVAPFTWMSSIMLFLASRFRGRRLVPIAVSVWGAGIVGILSNPKALPYLLSLNDTLFVLFGVLGGALLWVQSVQLRNQAERGTFVEIAD